MNQGITHCTRFEWHGNMGFNSSYMDEQLTGRGRTDDFESIPYFVTICTFGRQLTLGKLLDSQVELNDTGLLVEQEWLRTGENIAELKLDAYCIMPNHFHAILWLQNNDTTTLGKIIEKFKATVNHRVNAAQNTPGIPFWQPSYHSHVIGSERAVPAMRRYVNDNPVNWSRDLMNPLVGDPSCLIPAAASSEE
jgi:putative transposase